MVKENRIYKISCLLLVLISALIISLSIPKFEINLSEQVVSELVYFALVLIPLLIIGIIATVKIVKGGGYHKTSHKITAISVTAIWIILALIFTLILLGVNHKSEDYMWFLHNWTSYYKNHSIKESLYGIIEVTNYAPGYNYILILISRIPMYDLHLIKLVSFLFSILLSYFICKIISHIRKSEFNYILFVALMMLPCLIIEYSAWAQCDAIYTSFAIGALYFALRKKSKLSFLFLGLSFIFKFQFLFIVPILFILLIIKDEHGEHYLKWNDVWIPFAVYLINCIPVFAGRSLMEMLLVYAKQSVNDTRICGECANICLIYYKFLDVRPDTLVHNILLWTHVAITFAVLIFYLVLVFKNNKKKTFGFYDILFWGFAFSLTMVFLMPKMLDRFYFIAACLAITFMFSCRDKHSCILSVLTTLFFSLSMLSAVWHWPNSIAITMLVCSMINFIYLVFVIIKEYGKVLSRKHNTEKDATKKSN